jgi:hypothetical protein
MIGADLHWLLVCLGRRSGGMYISDSRRMSRVSMLFLGRSRRVLGRRVVLLRRRGRVVLFLMLLLCWLAMVLLGRGRRIVVLGGWSRRVVCLRRGRFVVCLRGSRCVVLLLRLLRRLGMRVHTVMCLLLLLVVLFVDLPGQVGKVLCAVASVGARVDGQRLAVARLPHLVHELLLDLLGGLHLHERNSGKRNVSARREGEKRRTALQRGITQGAKEKVFERRT